MGVMYMIKLNPLEKNPRISKEIHLHFVNHACN